MRVLFIQQDPFSSLGLMYLSSHLRKYGHETDVIITAMERDWVQAVAKQNPEVIAIPCTTGAHRFAISCARKLRTQLPEALIILGGSHPTFSPDVIKEPSIDLIIRGESEGALLDVLERVSAGETHLDIRNVHAKNRESEIVTNPLRPLIEEIDTLAFPDPLLYRRYGNLQSNTDYTMTTTRGCPYDCSFCYNVALKEMYGKHDPHGAYVRKRSVKNAIAELKYAKNTLGIQNIEFEDDIFTLFPHTFLAQFLKRFKEEINLPFKACTRPDLVTDDVVRKLKEAGCDGLMMGIESAVEMINNQVLRRDLTTEQIVAAGAIIRNHAIPLKTFSMLGAPHETFETAWETLKLAQEIRADCPRSSIAQPYPGTPLLSYCQENGLLEDGFHTDNMAPSYLVHNPIRLQDKEAIFRLHKVFGILARWPMLNPIAKRLLRWRVLDPFLGIIFYLQLAYANLRFYRYNLINFIKVSIFMRRSFFNESLSTQ